MPRIQVPVVGPSYQDESRDLNAQRTVNFYLRGGGPGGRGQVVLESFPGYVLETLTEDDAEVRGAIAVQPDTRDLLYVVAGDKLYEFNSLWEARIVGTLNTDFGPVKMEHSGTHIIIVEQIYRSTISTAYLYDLAEDIFIDLNALSSFSFANGDYEPVRGAQYTGSTSAGTFYLYDWDLDITMAWGANGTGKVWVYNITGTPTRDDGNPVTESFSGPRAGGGSGACFDNSDSLVDDGLDFHPSDGGFLDGRFILIESNTANVHWCEAMRYHDWPGTNVAVAQGDPDNLVAMQVINREVWLLGENTTEVWVTTDDPDMPYQRMSGAAMEWGCQAIASPAKLGNHLYWLAKNRRGGQGQIVRAEGYTQATPVASAAVSQAVYRYKQPEDAIFIPVSMDGHDFLIVTFPFDDATWLYDATTQQWTELGDWDQTAGHYHRHRSNCYAWFGNRHIFGDYSNGKVYSWRVGEHQEEGDFVRRERTFQHLVADGKSMLWHGVEIFLESGAAIRHDQMPSIRLSFSDDGGHSFGREIEGSVGRRGDRGLRVRFHRLGSSRDRIFRLAVGDAVPWRIFGGVADVEVSEW